MELLRCEACLEAGRLIVLAPRLVALDKGVAIGGLAQGLIRLGFTQIVFDFAHTEYIDSVGIGAIVSAYDSCRRAGGSLTLNRVGQRASKKFLWKVTIPPEIVFTDMDYSQLPRAPLVHDPWENLTALDGPFTPTPAILLGVDDATRRPSAQELESDVIGLERLIGLDDCTESHIQSFLEGRPHLLMGDEYVFSYPRVVLEREEAGPLVPDFMLRPSYSPYCDIYEIKRASAPLTVGRANRRRQSSAVREAIAQLRTYSEYFQSAFHRQRLSARLGICAYKPRLTALIGRRRPIDNRTGPPFSDQGDGVEVMTYDDLVDSVRRRADLGRAPEDRSAR